VFIARALVQDAPILILDEPMAGVDASTEAIIIALLKKLRDAGRTVIVVHHDLTTVQSYFDWLVMLNVRIIAQGPVAQTYSADNLRAAYGRHLAMIAVPAEEATS
jgi:manganese/zinc/iron transport system ATP- binding protein